MVGASRGGLQFRPTRTKPAPLTSTVEVGVPKPNEEINEYVRWRLLDTVQKV